MFFSTPTYLQVPGPNTAISETNWDQLSPNLRPSCRQAKNHHLQKIWLKLTIEQISDFVQIDFEVGDLDVELEVLVHRVDVVEDVVDDARDDTWRVSGEVGKSRSR